MVVQPRRDERPHLVEHVGQRDEERRHQRHFERHEKGACDVGGDHGAADWQRPEQRRGEERINLLRPGKQAQQHDHHRDNRAQQPATQLDEMRNKRFLGGFRAGRCIAHGSVRGGAAPL